MAEITSARGNYSDRVDVYTDFLEWIHEDGNPNFDLDRFRQACGLTKTCDLLSLEAQAVIANIPPSMA
jgi:hypothetical protein